MSLNQSRRPRPVIDPDLSIGLRYGYRDPYRAAGVRVYDGPPPATPAPKRRTSTRRQR